MIEREEEHGGPINPNVIGRAAVIRPEFSEVQRDPNDFDQPRESDRTRILRQY